MPFKLFSQVFGLLILLSSCKESKKNFVRGEYIVRQQNEYFFTPPAPLSQCRDKYPWEKRYTSSHLPHITKEFFRCKGNNLNPVVVLKKEGREPRYFRDCPGGRRHGLSMREGKEFVYPCLLELLNYIQEKTEKKVVITSGHRCPQHNSYVDPLPANWGSKHMLGAEVDFYVEGLEEAPDKVVELIQQYYKERAPFKGQAEYEKFARYDKSQLLVAPYYNKEIFVKIQSRGEGANFDNRHGFPYVTLQVRYDRDLNQRVVFEQKQAENYLRY